MKTTLKLEEIALFLLGFYFFSTLQMSWWRFIALLFLPDIGMLGYLVNSKIGAVAYNIFHHRGISILIGVIGYYLDFKWLYLAGIILFSHIAFDRIFGYGLKYYKGFKHTHLGIIGK